MKLLSLLIAMFLLSSCMFVRSGEIHLEWDANPEGTVANPVTYKVYSARVLTPSTGPVTWTAHEAGTDTNKIITGLEPGKYLFFATASLNGLESLPSEELATDILPTKPGKPRKKVALQTSTDLNRWSDLYVYTDESDAKRFYRIGVSVN